MRPSEKGSGFLEKSISSYKKAYKTDKYFGDSYWSLANLKTYKFQKDEIIKMRNELDRVDLSLKDKTYFHFALAQGCEANGDYEEAFFHYKKGNKIKSEQNKYLIERMDKDLQLVLET